MIRRSNRTSTFVEEQTYCRERTNVGNKRNIFGRTFYKMS